MLKKFLLTIVVALACLGATFAQSNTTEKLGKQYGEAMSFYFYHNTLRMLNQKDDKDFDELIKDIEKMKLLLITKGKEFNYPKLVGDYKAESFEEIMTSRHQGKNFDILLKEENGKTKGMIVLVNDSANLYVLDIVGHIALDKVTKLYSTLDESTDVGKRLKDFTRKDDDDDDGDKKDDH
ncbi:MAG: DUF4252 domain-containing protein [Bacteroidia bacterium]|nr:DUF4252 domain-containing protein [Bacteroidia bacterium]